MIELSMFEWLVVLAAAFRITFMIVEEDGFLNVSGYIKYILGMRWQIIDEDIEILPKRLNLFNLYRQDVRENLEYYEEIPKTEFAHALKCFYCTSIWVGLLYLIGLLLIPEYIIIFSIPFFISTIALIINNKMI